MSSFSFVRSTKVAAASALAIAVVGRLPHEVEGLKLNIRRAGTTSTAGARVIRAGARVAFPKAARAATPSKLATAASKLLSALPAAPLEPGLALPEAGLIMQSSSISANAKSFPSVQNQLTHKCSTYFDQHPHLASFLINSVGALQLRNTSIDPVPGTMRLGNGNYVVGDPVKLAAALVVAGAFAEYFELLEAQPESEDPEEEGQSSIALSETEAEEFRSRIQMALKEDGDADATFDKPITSSVVRAVTRGSV